MRAGIDGDDRAGQRRMMLSTIVTVRRSSRAACATLMVVAGGCDGCQLRLDLDWPEEAGTSVDAAAETAWPGASDGAEDGTSGPTSGSSGAPASLGDPPGTLCGNDVLDPGEACDDGNTVDEDGCPSGRVGQCMAFAWCGDGVVWAGHEDCDDGNDAVDDDCVDDCTYAACGDGFVQSVDEECDDANAVDNDQCDNSCRRARYIFVTSGTLDGGEIGGLEGADMWCASFAAKVPLAGKFMAWLSLSSPWFQCPATRFPTPEHFDGVYRTVRGDPVARGWAGLISGHLESPVDVDEDGQSVEDGAIAWSNTDVSGTVASPLWSESCTGWTNRETPYGRVGLPAATSSKWSDFELHDCGAQARLYCVQVD